VDRIPILRMGPVLLVSIQVDMHDQLALALQDDLTNAITAHGSKGVLLDISSLGVVDSFMGRMLANIAGIARVLDAATVVVGMQPAVAITLVELGLSLEGVRTALNVEKGIAMLQAAVAAHDIPFHTMADRRSQWGGAVRRRSGCASARGRVPCPATPCVRKGCSRTPVHGAVRTAHHRPRRTGAQTHPRTPRTPRTRELRTD